MQEDEGDAALEHVQIWSRATVEQKWQLGSVRAHSCSSMQDDVRQSTEDSIKDVIRRFVREAGADAAAAQPHTSTTVAVDQSLQQRAAPAASTGSQDVYLKVTVLEGEGFSGYIADIRADDTLYTFGLHMQFRHQRAASAKPAAACVNPQFQETFVFLLNDKLPTTAAEWTALLELDAPLQLVLTRQRTVQQQSVKPRRELVGSCSIDWRKALVCEDDSVVALQLQSEGHDSVLTECSNGRLLCRLDIVAASPADAKVPFAAEAVTRIMTLQSARSAELQRFFYLYTKQWWAEFVQLGAPQRDRRVKLFAQDELGRHRCVCSFLPLSSGMIGELTGRLVHSSLHAARLVSLIPYERTVTVGGSRLETWHSFHAFLVRGRGDCEDHALLLAALLTALGLDAYVCIGEVVDDHNDTTRKDHVWVATYAGEYTQQRVTFWESLTGQRYDVSPQHAHSASSSSAAQQQQQQQQQRPHTRSKQQQHHFYSIACMFSARSLYANKQPDSRLSHTLLDLSDARLWKCLDSNKLVSLPHEHTDLALLRSPVDSVTAGATLEAALRQLLTAHRAAAAVGGLNTLWDNSLSMTLQGALAAYETERVTGVTAAAAAAAAAGGTASSEFQAAIKRAVPDQHCFKGYPSCYAHTEPQRLFSSLLSSAVGADIVATVGDHTRFALRVQVHAYAECAVAVWVMLAVRYQPCASVL
jgi:CEP76 C2 domain/Transglutaminase-like superfamily